MFWNKKKPQEPSMIAIGDVLVSGDLGTEMFACDIAACKGACCVEGDLGAPLDQDELRILKKIYEKVEPYLSEKGKKAIQSQGVYIKDMTGNYSTPLIHGRECAYTVFTEDGIAACGIERAFEDGNIDFQKPISCHLYPIRINSNKGFDAVNYDRWGICFAACTKGKKEGVRVYEFAKAALVRKYGEAFYEELNAIFQMQLKMQEEEAEG